MILITGGSGFIGSRVTKLLLEQGYSIRVLDVKPPEEKGVQFLKADITKDSLTSCLKDIDTVIHLAGLISYSTPREEIFHVNVGGTKNLLETRNNAEKFILSSSVSVYPETDGVITEKTPAKPETAYGESKLTAEKLVESSGLKHISLRLAPIYGIGSLIWLKNLMLLERGFPIPNTKAFTHVLSVENAAQAFALSVKRGRGPYVIADKNPVPFVDFAKELVSLLGKKPKVFPAPFVSLIARVFRMKTYLDVLTKNRHYDISRAEKELEYIPSGKFHEGLKEMVQWYIKISR